MTGTETPAGNTTTVEVLEGFRGRSAGRVSLLGADPAHAPGGYKSSVPRL